MAVIIKVQSSNIKSCEYEAETEILTVTFHRGGTYRYYDVPNEVIEGLLESKSSGKYFHAHIRNKYQTEKLQDV